MMKIIIPESSWDNVEWLEDNLDNELDVIDMDDFCIDFPSPVTQIKRYDD